MSLVLEIAEMYLLVAKCSLCTSVNIGATEIYIEVVGYTLSCDYTMDYLMKMQG